MIVLIGIIIAFIIYVLTGKKYEQHVELSDMVNIKHDVSTSPYHYQIQPQIHEPIAEQPQPQPQPQSQSQPQPQIKETKQISKRKNVRFTPTINVRSFNVNDGEIVEQYVRQI